MKTINIIVIGTLITITLTKVFGFPAVIIVYVIWHKEIGKWIDKQAKGKS